MSQQLQVLQCYSCETFQTQISKKSTKWECKICGEKQSIKKVFGQGSGKDCRIHVQRLNDLRKKKVEYVESFSVLEFGGNAGQQPQKGQQAMKLPQGGSKWAKYLSQSSNNNSESDDSDQDVKWHPIPQSTPTAYELPHVKKQKIGLDPENTSEFNPFVKKDSNKKDKLFNFDLDLDDALDQITDEDSTSISFINQEPGIKGTQDSESSNISAKSRSDLNVKRTSQECMKDGIQFKENKNLPPISLSSVANLPVSNTIKTVSKLNKQESGSSDASPKSHSSSQDLFKSNSDLSLWGSDVSELSQEKIIGGILNQKSETSKNNNMQDSFNAISKPTKDMKDKSNAELKRALSLFENIDDYTEEEIDVMFSL